MCFVCVAPGTEGSCSRPAGSAKAQRSFRLKKEASLWAAATQEDAGGKRSFLSSKAKASWNEEKTLLNEACIFTNFYHVAEQFKVIDAITLNDAEAGNEKNCWTKWLRIDEPENNLSFYIKLTMMSSLLTNLFFKSK